MINNRLFKKINSVFWALLTWLPIVLLILSTAFKDFNYQFDGSGQSFWTYLQDYFVAAFDSLSNSGADFWYNPFSDIFGGLMDILDATDSSTSTFVVMDICAWVCWVQVWRLFTYVFMWFIDLLTNLFDYLSFNKRGDN